MANPLLTALGTKVAWVLTAPATIDIAGYEALTWANISHAKSSGNLSASNTAVQSDTLNDGTLKTGGKVEIPDLVVTFLKNQSAEVATIQDIVRERITDKTASLDLSLRLTLSSGEIQYCRAAVLGEKESTADSPDSEVTIEFTFGIHTNTVRYDRPTPTP